MLQIHVHVFYHIKIGNSHCCYNIIEEFIFLHLFFPFLDCKNGKLSNTSGLIGYNRNLPLSMKWQKLWNYHIQCKVTVGALYRLCQIHYAVNIFFWLEQNLGLILELHAISLCLYDRNNSILMCHDAHLTMPTLIRSESCSPACIDNEHVYPRYSNWTPIFMLRSP
jgi:hypothetical protein